MLRSRAEYLVNRLIGNELTRPELDELLAGMGTDDALKEYSDVLERYFNSLVDEADEGKQTTIYIQEPVQSSSQSQTVRPPLIKRFYGSYGKMAALLVIMLAFLAILYLIPYQFASQTNLSAKPASVNQVADREEVVPRGNRKSLRLADGTYVRMNAESKMIFPVAFDARSRRVLLEGEAYFDVAKDKTRPFAIALNDLNITVLGTAFNIKSYESDEDVAVTVRSGRVSVAINSTSLPPVMLTRNEKLIFNKRTEKYRIMRIDAMQDCSWIEGYLLFNQTPLETVEKTLERWYAIDIQIKDKALYETSLTGKHLNENLVSALESVCFAINATYEIKGQIVVIRK